MCNLYSMTTNREAIRQLFRVTSDLTANQPPLPAIFPDQLAPVVRVDRDGVRRMEMMRWGFPPPPNFGNRPVTNVRNVASSYWRGWLKPNFRCLVPATSFCEYTDTLPKVPHWFALGPDRPPFAFAGIWRPWTGTRGTARRRTSAVQLLDHRAERHRAPGACQGDAGATDRRGGVGHLADRRHAGRAGASTAVAGGTADDRRHRPARGRGGVTRRLLTVIALLLLLLLAGSAVAQPAPNVEPDPTLTPGEIASTDPAVVCQRGHGCEHVAGAAGW
jgi:SOS response associated peptidase (SRAP)